jgi:hypothetical protein
VLARQIQQKSLGQSPRGAVLRGSAPRESLRLFSLFETLGFLESAEEPEVRVTETRHQPKRRFWSSIKGFPLSYYTRIYASTNAFSNFMEDVVATISLFIVTILIPLLFDSLHHTGMKY